ncbi:MAG: FIST N-terminal domain-containing protein [Methanolobus sp.]
MYIPESEAANILLAVEKLNPKCDETVLLLLPEKDTPDMEYLIWALNEKKINFIGGIFPSIIYGDNIYNSGAILTLLPVLDTPLIVKDLSADTLDIQEQLATLKPSGKCTAFVLIDGLSSSISHFLSSLFQQFGVSVKYLGAGAGSISLEQKPCIFNPDGIHMNAAIVTLVDMETRLGVRHGWKYMTGPFVITRSEGNIIKELNWNNPFEIYKEAVEQDSGLELCESSFFEIAKGYPFGIYSEGSEDIVRVPLQVTENGELVFVGEVTENTVLNILKGEKSSLIASAGQAIKDCFSYDTNGIKHCFIVDCITRVLFLEDDFKEELKSISREIKRNDLAIIQEGVLSLGEIASREKGILEFFNKTIVVGTLHE